MADLLREWSVTGGDGEQQASTHREGALKGQLGWVTHTQSSEEERGDSSGRGRRRVTDSCVLEEAPGQEGGRPLEAVRSPRLVCGHLGWVLGMICPFSPTSEP